MSTQNDYIDAMSKGQPEVQAATRRFFEQPQALQEWVPLLYWLIGEPGTPPFKQSRSLADYRSRTPVRGQQCDNCRFAWSNMASSKDPAIGRPLYICSQIRDEIEPEAWCKLWRTFAKEKA